MFFFGEFIHILIYLQDSYFEFPFGRKVDEIQNSAKHLRCFKQLKYVMLGMFFLVHTMSAGKEVCPTAFILVEHVI